MDLTNKQVTVASMTVGINPPETTVKVNISQEVVPGVFQVLHTFDMKFERMYYSMSDADLLTAISENLALIPD